jgi:hypothetical protein
MPRLGRPAGISLAAIHSIEMQSIKDDGTLANRFDSAVYSAIRLMR